MVCYYYKTIFYSSEIRSGMSYGGTKEVPTKKNFEKEASYNFCFFPKKRHNIYGVLCACTMCSCANAERERERERG